jgi:hypothetical protein
MDELKAGRTNLDVKSGPAEEEAAP